jgi:hypothetical protein
MRKWWNASNGSLKLYSSVTFFLIIRGRSRFVGREVCTIFRVLKKRIQNYEYTISYKREYLEIEKKSQQITSTS